MKPTNYPGVLVLNSGQTCVVEWEVLRHKHYGIERMGMWSTRNLNAVVLKKYLEIMGSAILGVSNNSSNHVFLSYSF